MFLASRNGFAGSHTQEVSLSCEIEDEGVIVSHKDALFWRLPLSIGKTSNAVTSPFYPA
jgi:hypothetical protein